MASIRQQARVIKFGFSPEYANTLTNNQAAQLIGSVYRVADAFYNSDLNKLTADVREFIQYKQQEHKQ